MNWRRLFSRKPKQPDFTLPQWVELHRIGGDVYLNGRKIIFALDFENPPKIDSQFRNVDWLIGWAKIGMIKSGYKVAYFHARDMKDFKQFNGGE